jgi:hypothetical protein
VVRLLARLLLLLFSLLGGLPLRLLFDLRLPLLVSLRRTGLGLVGCIHLAENLLEPSLLLRPEGS